MSEPSATIRVLNEACSTTAGATSTTGRRRAVMVSLRVMRTLGVLEVLSANQRGGRGIVLDDSLGTGSPRAASAAIAKIGGKLVPSPVSGACKVHSPSALCGNS